MRDDAVYLQHITECISLIHDYLRAGDDSAREARFYDDFRTQDAVLRRLETLADAASHLSDSLTSRHTEIPWRQVRDFRNVLAHGYTDVRLDRVWQVIVGDLPAIRAVIETELGRVNDA